MDEVSIAHSVEGCRLLVAILLAKWFSPTLTVISARKNGLYHLDVKGMRVPDDASLADGGNSSRLRCGHWRVERLIYAGDWSTCSDRS